MEQNYVMVSDRYSNQACMVTFRELEQICDDLGFSKDFTLVGGMIKNGQEVVAVPIF